MGYRKGVDFRWLSSSEGEGEGEVVTASLSGWVEIPDGACTCRYPPKGPVMHDATFIDLTGHLIGPWMGVV